MRRRWRRIYKEEEEEEEEDCFQVLLPTSTTLRPYSLAVVNSPPVSTKDDNWATSQEFVDTVDHNRKVRRCGLTL